MKFVHLSDVHLVAGGGELNSCTPSQRLRSCLDDILQWHSDAEFTGDRLCRGLIHTEATGGGITATIVNFGPFQKSLQSTILTEATV